MSKKKNKENIIDLKKEQKEQKSKIIDKGTFDIKDFLAPTSIDRSNVDYLVVSNKFVRNFMVVGFPNNVSIGWLSTLYDYNGDLDCIIHIEPQSNEKAIDELTERLTKLQAQYAIEEQKGSIKNISKIQMDIEETIEQRSNLERKSERLFQVEIGVNLYSDSLINLNKETQKIDQSLRGSGILMEATILRQDDGYKSVLPIGKSFIADKFRNFNSGGIVSCFPFYNSDIRHDNGVFCGINLSTWSRVSINFFDRSIFNNSNFNVIGRAGTGKTFFISLLTIRSIFNNIRTFVIDPESEYKKLTEAIGGSYVLISPGSKQFINVFDIEAEDIVDGDFRPTGEKIVNLKNKISDIINLIAVMNRGLNGEEITILSKLIEELYVERGITTDPESLYETEPVFDSENLLLYHSGMQKKMPRFKDFHKKLSDYAKTNSDFKKLSNSLEIFVEGGLYDLFDCETSPSLKNLKDSPIITFDIGNLEENILRPIGMYITLSWAWEKFIKKNQLCLKRILCDEAWMMTKKGMPGVEYTSSFLENMARRIRKRNGGLLCASQNYTEFASSESGKAVLSNAVVNIFLGQDSTDIKALKSTFNLSDGEANFLLSASRGQMLIKLKDSSAIAEVVAFDFEKELIEKVKIS